MTWAKGLGLISAGSRLLAKVVPATAPVALPVSVVTGAAATVAKTAGK